MPTSADASFPSPRERSPAFRNSSVTTSLAAADARVHRDGQAPCLAKQPEEASKARSRRRCLRHKTVRQALGLGQERLRCRTPLPGRNPCHQHKDQPYHSRKPTRKSRVGTSEACNWTRPEQNHGRRRPGHKCKQGVVMAKDRDVPAEIQTGEHPNQRQGAQHQVRPAQKEASGCGSEKQGAVHRSAGHAISREAFPGRERSAEVRQHGQTCLREIWGRGALTLYPGHPAREFLKRDHFPATAAFELLVSSAFFLAFLFSLSS